MGATDNVKPPGGVGSTGDVNPPGGAGSTGDANPPGGVGSTGDVNPPEKPSLAHRIEQSMEAQREAFTMTLYMAIVVLSVQIVGEPSESAWEDIRLILGTAVGLLLAHLLAFRLAASLFAAPAMAENTGERLEELEVSTWAVIRAAFLVVAVAVLPYLILDVEWASLASTIALSLIIGASAYIVGRAYGRSNAQGWMYAGVVTLLALGIAIIKAILSH